MNKNTTAVIVVATAMVSLSTSTNYSRDGRPFFTGCRSPEQETFTCWWDPGAYGNLTGTPAFKVLYSKSGCQDPMQCPDYVTSGENSCYFNETYTSVWTGYCFMICVDTEWGAVNSQPHYFDLLDILQPDPPVSLTWTLLNGSDSTHYADVMISWSPPPSADVDSGWISLQYQLRYRSSNSEWKMSQLLSQNSLPLYALETLQYYEVEVRCKPLYEGEFSQFSKTLRFILDCKNPSAPVSEVVSSAWVVLAPLTMALSLFLLYSLCSTARIKAMLLPPIPVPKIAGINTDLLQSGSPAELGILSGFFSVSSTMEPEEEPWEDFPELDLQDDTKVVGEPKSVTKGPLTIGSIDSSESGWESIGSAETDCCPKNGKSLIRDSLDSVSSETKSVSLDAVLISKAGLLVGTRLGAEAIKSTEISQHSTTTYASASCLLTKTGKENFKTGPSPNALYKDGGNTTFYSYVADIRPQRGVITVTANGYIQGCAKCNAHTGRQDQRCATSEYLKGMPHEGLTLPENDANYYVTL
ncbi:growth hormone receptor-like [Acipenser oxyrinchus oxyrinchus]|uniref:Growth hormone receptor-like n=1 Tax=Acipenser oxyrinchus oxyrinchus TaxID=40147 RepID=A0AAD8CTQ2_ACIOX|nr:growth hormone receptor-like [Acipenser oxyrinchus oxyrinchus]